MSQVSTPAPATAPGAALATTPGAALATGPASSLVLTEEQEMLQRTARDLIREKSPVSSLRALRDSRDATGFSRPLWKEMADLGLPGMLFPDSLGGSGMGYADLGPVLEELGRELVSTPFVSTVILSGNAVLQGAGELIKQDVIPAIARGERLLATAFQEGPRYDPWFVTTRAEPAPGGYRLTGEKVFALDGHVADQLVVTARTSGAPHDRNGLTLFLVDADAPGVSRTRTHMLDSRNAARIRLEAVMAPSSAILGQPGRGADLLDRLLDQATICLSAEMLGGIQEAFDRTMAYLKERRQFGVPIGSFQALKHRAAWMYTEIELARSIVLEALRALDEDRPDVPRLASAAKARLSDVFIQVAGEAIQMHGGIGMTDELDLGFYLKRAKVAEFTFGDSAWHRQRFAALEGF